MLFAAVVANPEWKLSVSEAMLLTLQAKLMKRVLRSNSLRANMASIDTKPNLWRIQRTRECSRP